MRQTDIAIAGGGLAGSLAAAMLGRAGYRVVLIDPHTAYPPDFRCEKLDGAQAKVLRKTGIADAVLRAGTFDGQTWVARFGRLLEKRPGDQHGIMYDTLVNTIRAQIPANVEFILDKVMDIATSDERQTVTLSKGEPISARLVVVANGLNVGLRHKLGMERQDLSKGHSIMLGFDLVPVGRPAFSFPGMTYYAEHPRDRTAYITLFPIGETMRANLSCYRDMDDPWLRQFRQAPRDTLKALMPGLEKIVGDYDVGGGPVKIRPVDLYVTTGLHKAGVVLVGDAFATSCPGAGTGAGKALVDVERLCNAHIPRWLATPGMSADKIAAYYADPVKQAYDRFAITKAFWLKSMSIDPGVTWAARRWARFIIRFGLGQLRALRTRRAPPPAQAERAIGGAGLGRAA
jgi:2-polyprenyl-6-methoxyphenol hydroxylase-like FAD-dependent oxidoreductase